MAFESGHGATLVLAASAAFTPDYTSYGGFDLSRPSLDTSHLATKGTRTKIGGDLYELGPMTSTYLVDPSEMLTSEDGGLIDVLFDAGAVPASGVITLDLVGSGDANFAGSGHVTGFAMEEITTDQLLVASITTQWDDWPTIAETA